MAQAVFVRGNPHFIPYTAGSAVTAGDVIVENGVCLIAHADIAAGALGSVSIGGGEYDFLATSGDTVDRFDALYWDDTGNNAEESPTSNTALGVCTVAKVSGDTTIRAYHQLPADVGS